MNEPEPLHLIVLYDANHNQYSVLTHNQSAEAAKRLVEEQTAAECSGASLIVLGQAKHHREEDPERCRACREIVDHKAHISPKPRFTRRK